MQTLQEFKRGDTFAFVATLLGADKRPITGAAASLRAELRNSRDEKIADFAISETATAGKYMLRISDTTAWPLEVLYTDIQYEADGIIVSTETIAIPVVKDITV